VVAGAPAAADGKGGEVNRVLMFRSNLLGYSETFILSQRDHLQRWEAVLVGEQRAHPGLDLGERRHLLVERRRSMLGRLRAALNRRHAGSDAGRLRAEGARLVHAHFGVDAVGFWPLARQLGLPMLVTLHGYDINTDPAWWRSGAGGAAMKRYPQRLLALGQEPAVGFIAVSEAIRQRAIEVGLPAAKLRVRPIGVDTGQFVPGPIDIGERRGVLFVGRLVEKKGLRYLIEAIAQLGAGSRPITLQVVGDGPLRAELEALARRLGVDAEFLGVLGSAAVRQRLQRARVLCLPSVTAENGDAEGLPIVILEAQSCGVPVITSARGGATEGIVDGLTGYAHAEGDVPALAERLDTLLRDDALAAAMSRAARRHAVERFDIGACTRALEADYDQWASLAS
jgi:glycosyltransferase involved in cell wall biosynthesis